MRTHTTATVILVGLIALISGTAHAQSKPEPRLTVSLGAIETVRSFPLRRQFTVYPEIGVYSNLYQSIEAGLTLGVGLYVAGWKDDPMSRCPHCITYSQKSGTLGARAAIRLDQFLLPLSFWGGASLHSIRRAWVDWTGKGQDSWGSHVALEMGVHLEIPISDRIGIEPRSHMILPMPNSEDDPYFTRFGWGVGFSYAL